MVLAAEPGIAGSIPERSSDGTADLAKQPGDGLVLLESGGRQYTEAGRGLVQWRNRPARRDLYLERPDDLRQY